MSAVVAAGAIAAGVALSANPKTRAQMAKALSSGASRVATVGAAGAKQASRAGAKALEALGPMAKRGQNNAQKTSKAAFAIVRQLLK